MLSSLLSSSSNNLLLSPNPDFNYGSLTFPVQTSNVNPTGGSTGTEEVEGPAKGYYPGLENDGNLCYLNAVLQSLAALKSFRRYLEGVIGEDNSINTSANGGEALVLRKTKDVSLGGRAGARVARSLDEVLRALNTPQPRRTTLQSTSVGAALLTAEGKSHLHINSADQQDAQEFFVILTDAVNEELEKSVKRKRRLERQGSEGLRELFNSTGIETPKSEVSTLSLASQLHSSMDRRRHLRTPFTALMAQKVSCTDCGYTEAIHHYPSHHLTLSVPFATMCRLEDLLGEYTKLELLESYSCRKCTLIFTKQKLEAQLSRLEHPTASHPSEEPPKITPSRKKRIREVKQRIERVQQAIVGNVEKEVVDVVLERAEGKTATKQSMFARAPDALTIHLSRSAHFSMGYAVKNNCLVRFPEILDLGPYCTNGELSTRPQGPISYGSPSGQSKENLYRLCSIVVHLGTHSYGHYITFRRRPGVATDGEDGWFHVSDETVSSASAHEALNCNPFLLFYERIPKGDPASPPIQPRVLQNL
ncbi:cysteine proteinase [Atractiella rhizophila]|nr:cysteine proteinase [Atractiella rhizophila]